MSGKPAPKFTIEELLNQLRQEEIEDGITARELVVKAGLPPTNTNMGAMGRKINDLLALGHWESAGRKKVWSEALQNYVRSPAYRPKKEK